MAEIGLKLAQPGASFDEMVGAFQAAEECGFAAAWLNDHLTALGTPDAPTMEAWTLLAALAARTRTLRIGVLVTDTSLRHPAMLAREAVTVDHISGGRLEVGLGAGSPLSETDYRAYGIHQQSIGERLGRLAEACQAMKLLWTQETASFSGRYLRLENARPAIWPLQQPHPPIWIGGSGDRTLRIAARHADAWNYLGPLDDFPEAVGRLHRAWEAVGRNPATLRISAQFFVEGKSPTQLREEVGRYESAGADTLMAIPYRPYSQATIRRLADILLG